MTKQMVYKIMIVIGLHINPNVDAAFFKEQGEGWHWYKNLAIEQPKEFNNAVIPKAVTPTQIINAYKEQLEKKLHLAIVAPTTKNILAYQEMQRDVMQRSQNFAKTWMQVIYENPHLDHTLVAPVNQKARHIYLDAENNRILDTIGNLKEQYGLFFFFSGECRYCHQFAPIVKQFSTKYGWQVIAISVDGGKVDGFQAVAGQELLTKWRVPVLPALFAVNPKTEQVLPLAFGLTTVADIETRVMILLKEQGL